MERRISICLPVLAIGLGWSEKKLRALCLALHVVFQTFSKLCIHHCMSTLAAAFLICVRCCLSSVLDCQHSSLPVKYWSAYYLCAHELRQSRRSCLCFICLLSRSTPDQLTNFLSFVFCASIVAHV